MGSSEPFHVVDANTMETIYTIDGLITKGSAAVSTAYATEENDHQVYIYMVPYNCNTDENFWIISDKDKPNRTMKPPKPLAIIIVLRQ